jgi:hypothetical protein
MKTLSLKLPELLFEQLTSIAKKRGESKSALVREAIKLITGENHDLNRGSCLDIAKDLAGSVSGPKDLSFNKKHLRGYGE